MPAAEEIANTPLIANARMHSSGARAAGAAWTSLLNWVVARAGRGFEVVRHLQPGTGAQLRTVATTRASPIPLFVATAAISPYLVGKLQAAFMSAARPDELKAERDMLLIADFVTPEQAPYQALRVRAEAAAIYPDVWCD